MSAGDETRSTRVPTEAAPIRGSGRYRRIIRFAALYLAQSWWFELVLPRFGLSRLAARGRSKRLLHVAQQFRVLAVDLGGLMIKVGQFLSSRLDVLPPEITKELEGLQDEVPPVPFPQIRALAETELGQSLDLAYSWFDETPVAAASFGQAHRARLAAQDSADTGFAEVVVKVQRPGIQAIIEVDLAALRRIAGWLSRVKFVSRRVDMPALVEEFAQVSLAEVDYLNEASNAERFAENFADNDQVGTPDIVWERTTRRVLTLSNVTAIKINDVEGLRAAGIDPAEVASRFANVMLGQLFSDGYFHADPHPGNIFVTPLGSAPLDGDSAEADATAPDWSLTFIDFGMMGEVPDSMREGLKELIIAVATRDGRRLVNSVTSVGVLLPSADTVELERALTELFSRFGGMSIADLQRVDESELRDFSIEFGDVVRDLPFQLPENFLLLIRSMSLTSGLSSALDPEFNMWGAVEPYAAGLMRSEGGNLAQSLTREVVSVAQTMIRLPRKLDDLTTRIEEGRLEISTPRLDRRMASLERVARGVVSAIIFAGLLIGGIILLDTSTYLGGILIGVSAIPLIHSLIVGTRRT